MRAISALALDPAGARLITGGYDFDVKLWDFAGMDNTLQSFRSFTPCEWWAKIFAGELGKNMYNSLIHSLKISLIQN